MLQGGFVIVNVSIHALVLEKGSSWKREKGNDKGMTRLN
jgi:hypothetical protein